jgi:hypothetical protein
MDVGHCLHGIQLYDHRVFDQQVHRVLANDDLIVDDDDAALLRDREARLAKLIHKRIFVPLKKSAAKRVADSQSAADDPLRQIVQHDASAFIRG